MTKSKKIFAVSDIHGNFTALKKALDEAGFDRENEEHLLVCCGDCFDRGNENYNVLKYLERIKNKVMILGNHEDMLKELFYSCHMKRHNFENGTDKTIAEFFGKYSIDQNNDIDFSGNNRTVDRLLDFIGEMQNYYETENYIFTHGWLPTVTCSTGVHTVDDWQQMPVEEWRKARWTKWTDMYEKCTHISDKTIVCGHTPVQRAIKFDSQRTANCSEIYYGDGVIAIDAGTDISGRVNVLILDEPLKGLDDALKKRILKRIQDASKEILVIFITHDREELSLIQSGGGELRITSQSDL